MKCTGALKHTNIQTPSVIITLYEFLGFAALPD